MAKRIIHNFLSDGHYKYISKKLKLKVANGMLYVEGQLIAFRVGLEQVRTYHPHGLPGDLQKTINKHLNDVVLMAKELNMEITS